MKSEKEFLKEIDNKLGTKASDMSKSMAIVN
jgi:hypothetical protein